jgi:hypothetical protein
MGQEGRWNARLCRGQKIVFAHWWATTAALMAFLVLLYVVVTI